MPPHGRVASPDDDLFNREQTLPAHLERGAIASPQLTCKACGGNGLRCCGGGSLSPSSPRPRAATAPESSGPHMNHSPRHGPRDIHHLVWVILWLLGAGVLFPWNAFISAPDYFTSYYEYVAESAELNGSQQSLWDNIITWFTVAYSTANLLGQIMIVWRGTGVLSISARMLSSLYMLFGSMIVVPVLSYCSVAPDTAFAVLVLLSAFVGICSALLASSTFGIGALFPAQFTQAVMLGNGAAGMTVSAMRVLTKWLISGDTISGKRHSGAIYFYLATAWMLFCVVGFVALRRLRFAQAHVEEFAAFSLIHLRGETVGDADDTEAPPTACSSPPSQSAVSGREATAPVAPLQPGQAAAPDGLPALQTRQEGVAPPGGERTLESPTPPLGGGGAGWEWQQRQAAPPVDSPGAEEKRLLTRDPSTDGHAQRHGIGRRRTWPRRSRAASTACSRRSVHAVSVTGGSIIYYAGGEPGAAASFDGPPVSICRAVGSMAFTVWLTLAVTISVFPGMTSGMTSDNIGGGWLPVWLILAYNCTDVLGRSLPRWIPLAPRLAVLLSVVRLCFVPLFVLRAHSLRFPGDYVPFLLIVTLGVSNGFVSSHAMMHGASSPNLQDDQRQRAGAAMSLALLAGICTGSYAGLALTHWFPSPDGSSSAGPPVSYG
eukprot:TRINITY_DN230_c0_g1_i2.p1 TRINITY_DN230_c0_g1~~TRINITY_DN230_c0_g1_i2.p1  ORF type:complete len:686 (+),score=121.66 TRINITY_DN230_c0_g1_i2:84-2060(+)